jgi:hypothetical protein
MRDGNGTKVLVRSRQGRMVAGVCPGAAENIASAKQGASAGR